MMHIKKFNIYGHPNRPIHGQKIVVGCDGLIHAMSCTICSKIECRKNLFAFKLDNFSEHVGKRKAKVTTKSVQTSKFFYSKVTTCSK
jgi:hypothetical protein